MKIINYYPKPATSNKITIENIEFIFGKPVTLTDENFAKILENNEEFKQARKIGMFLVEEFTNPDTGEAGAPVPTEETPVEETPTDEETTTTTKRRRSS